MQFAQSLLLFTLLTTTASAQSFEQLGFLRLNDTTPRSARTTALGGANDSLGTDVSDACCQSRNAGLDSQPEIRGARRTQQHRGRALLHHQR